MEIRGERRCQACDTRWSYFETGEVACPACGSLRSVGVADRALHTDGPATLDVTAAKDRATAGDLREAAAAAADAAGDYVRTRGFIDAGSLGPLEDKVLAAYELREVGRHLHRTLDIDEEAEYYFLTLLEAVPDGDRLPPADVPKSLRTPRGLAVAAAVEAYLDDVNDWLGARDADQPPALDRVRGRVRDHHRRITALEGAVPSQDAERLVVATRALVAYARSGDPEDIERARTALDALA
ncbi:MAG: TFIIB-type zinc ribbon-containing protein [Halobacteriaceae archaeon]